MDQTRAVARIVCVGQSLRTACSRGLAGGRETGCWWSLEATSKLVGEGLSAGGVMLGGDAADGTGKWFG
jgi:hypothetical protein